MFKQLIILVILMISSAAYADDEAFTVLNTDIFAEADNLENAREDALKQGSDEALNILVRRILPQDELWKASNIKIGNSHEFRKDFKVTWERMTSNSYMAKIDYVFDEFKLKRTLNRLGVRCVDSYSHPYLILPVVNANQKELDTWNSVWGSMPTSFGLTKLQYSMGDLSDIVETNPAKIVGKPYNGFAELGKRYNVDRFVLVVADLKDDVITSKVRILEKYTDFTIDISHQFQNREDGFRNFAEKVLTAVDNYYKGYKLVSLNDLMVSLVKFSAADSQKIIKKLKDIGAIKEIIEKNKTKDFVEVDIYYSISPPIFVSLLKEQGILTKEKDGYTLLSLK